MASQLKVQDNYVVHFDTTAGENVESFAINHCVYRETELAFIILEQIDKETLTINKASIVSGEWVDEGLVAFTVDSIRDFLRANTGFNTASGGSGALDEVLTAGNTTGSNDISVNSGQSIIFNNGGFTGNLQEGTYTGNQTYTFPNSTGTIALTSDIPTAGHTIYDAPSASPVTQRNKLVFDGDAVTVLDGNDLTYGLHTKVTINAPSEFTALTDTPNSYSGEAAKVAVVNDAENGIVYKLPSEAGWQYRLETTLNEAQILSMGTTPINLFALVSDAAIDYKIIMIFKMNGSTGNFGGVNLDGLTIRTNTTYPTIGQNQVALINEAFIADGVDGSVVMYGQSSSLVSGFEFITPIALGDGLSISTGNTVNPSNGGSDTANCTLQIITLLNLL